MPGSFRRCESNQQVRRGICSTIPICKFYFRRASTRLTSRARDRRMRLAFPQVCARLSHMPAHATRTFYPQVCNAKAQRHKHGTNSGPKVPAGICRRVSADPGRRAGDGPRATPPELAWEAQSPSLRRASPRRCRLGVPLGAAARARPSACAR